MMLRPLLLVTVLLLAPPLRAAVACPGDCGDDGAVTVDELVKLVNIALGATGVADCPVGDGDGDGAVAINELIAAVKVALGSSCPVDPDALPTTVLSLVRGMAQLPTLADELSVAFDALGGPEPCELGGILQSACEDSGSGVLRVSVEAESCRVQTVEGPHRYEGPTRVIADGECGVTVDAGTLHFLFDWRFAAEAADGSDAVVAEHHLDTRLGPLLFGDPPCAIKGGGGISTGSSDYALADGRQFTVAMQDTTVAVGFFDFVGSCDPIRLVTDVDGAVAVGSGVPAGTAAAVVDVQLEVNSEARTLRVDGTLDLGDDGGSVIVSTPTILGFPLGSGCFSAGTLRVEHAGGVTLLHFPGDGSVAVDSDGDGSTDHIDPNCL